MSRFRPMWQQMLAALLWVLLRIGESGRMNSFGRQAMAHWQEHLPAAYRQIADPEMFFTRAGEEMLTQVDELTRHLAGPDLPGEDYLDKVARVNRARMEAEEIAKADSGMFPPPELTRTEWEHTTPQEDALIDWVWRMQAQQEGLAETHLSFPEAAAVWLLPIEYLEQMTAAYSPWDFWKNHPTEWEASVQARWERHQAEDATDR
ncbi:MAG: hypothetical protein BGO95_10715 [Micrococcales bacterium 73-13]|nr:MAG: hypothetical protein BGO95_10715 [Micrococcales bacterium 73-13]